MAEIVTVKVEGLAEIDKKLRLLPERLGNNALKRALRKGANVIRDQARANAKAIDDPQTREQIAKNIAVASGSKARAREAGGLLMRIGVQGGARPLSADPGTPGGNTTHWRFVEFGTSVARAQPFMRPAMANGAERAMQVTADAMNTEIDKELAKL